MTFRRTDVASRALALLALGLLVLSQAGCPTTMADIQASQLSEQDKAAWTVFEAERGWVETKTALNETLAELELIGWEPNESQKADLRALLHAGNAAVATARQRLQQGSFTGPGSVATALTALRDATRAINERRGVLSVDARR